MHKDMCYIIIQLFQLIQHSSISRIHMVTFQMPSISTKTFCQQRGFILDKQQWNVVQHHKSLTHHMHISSKLFIHVKHPNMHNTLLKYRNISMYITRQLYIQEMTLQILIFVCLVDYILISVFLNYWSLFLLVVERDLPDSEMLFSHLCTPGVLYTRSPTLGFGGKAPKICFWDVCWTIVLQTHGIGLTIVFSHGISPIK